MVNLSEIIKLNSVINLGDLGDGAVNVSTDTRNLKSSELFVAITGDKFNAMNFLDKVKEAGCKNVVYTKSQENDDIAKNHPDLNFVETKDSIIFLQELAHLWSVKFQNTGGQVICISGSNGKTTTKEMLYHLLKEAGLNVGCTQKNNNNHIGVPLTLFQIQKDTEVMIVELGSNHPGEIKTVCDIADPSIAYTTNIGYTHLEFFDSLEAVFAEESYPHEYIKAKKGKSIFFQNVDDKYLNTLNTESNCIQVGQSSLKDPMIFKNEKVILGDVEIHNNNITGEHNYFNLAAAFQIATTAFPSLKEKFMVAANNFKPTDNRSQWVKNGSTDIFLDAYNANPSSMKEAIKGFSSKVINPDKSLLIIGEMFELGHHAEKLHQEVAAFVNSTDFKNIVFIGSLGESFLKGCPVAKIYPDAASYRKEFCVALNSYDNVFIKGSRSLQLESLVDIT